MRAAPAYALLSFLGLATAQFGFFDQMFGGHDHGGGHGGHHPRHQAQNVPSDPTMYRQNYEQSHCTNYLCPDTLACVHFPHHCPCPWPQQDKFEIGDGQRICVSRGGFKEGEAARKVELARKGML